jgi:hypothetical protein
MCCTPPLGITSIVVGIMVSVIIFILWMLGLKKLNDSNMKLIEAGLGRLNSQSTSIKNNSHEFSWSDIHKGQH